MKLERSMRYILSLFVICLTLSPMQASASGAEARRAYIARDYEAALRTATTAAERGDSTAMMVLGKLYFEGQVVSHDYGTALKWWLSSANLGNSKAQNAIGFLYLKGLGVETNYNEAAKWFEAAAAQDEGYAYTHLGTMYESGQGFETSYTKALELYYEAAKILRKSLRSDPDDQEALLACLKFVYRRIEITTGLLADSASAKLKNGNSSQLNSR